MASPEKMYDDHGWIKLYRKSLSNGWLKNHNLWVFWCYCLLKASHRVHKVMIGNQQVTLQPGQFVFGRKKTSKETGLSERSIRTCVYNLCTLGNLTIKTTNKFSLITVVNWESYQDKGIKPTSKPTNDRPATDHIQECKNETKRICDEKSPSFSLEENKSKGNGKDPRVRPLINYFHSLCKEELDQEPTIEGVKDGSAIKRTLTENSEERIKNILDWYIKSPKALEHGLKISVALSNHSISEYEKKGKWLYEG